MPAKENTIAYLRHIAEFFASQGCLEMASKVYESMSQADSVFLLDIGETRETQGRLDEAEMLYKITVKKQPHWQLPYEHLASFLLRSHRWKEVE